MIVYDRQRDVCMQAPEPREGRRHERGERSRKAPEAQPPPAPPGDLAELLFGAVEAREDSGRVARQSVAGLGQLDRTRAALDQRQPDSRSSAATCWLTPDCVRCSASAENDPRAATSARTLNRRTSSISGTHRHSHIAIATDGGRWDARAAFSPADTFDEGAAATNDPLEVTVIQDPLGHLALFGVAPTYMPQIDRHLTELLDTAV